jgi:hypothetical protein
LFNLDRAAKEPADQPLIIVEGFFDTMKLHQHGCRKVVALMGSTLADITEAVQGGLGPEAAAKVGFHTPDEFLAELQTLAKTTDEPPPATPLAKTGKTLGYEIERVFVKLSPQELRENQQAIHRVAKDQMQS